MVHLILRQYCKNSYSRRFCTLEAGVQNENTQSSLSDYGGKILYVQIRCFHYLGKWKKYAKFYYSRGWICYSDIVMPIYLMWKSDSLARLAVT